MYFLSGILGFAVVMAPFLFGYSDNFLALWSSIILGGMTMLISFMEATSEKKIRWEFFVAAAAGIAVIALPFVFGYTHLPYAMWSSVAIGLALTILAGLNLYYYDETSFT